MNDITALMATMKAAAEKATQGEWCAFTDSATKTYAVHTPKDKRCEDVIKWTGFDGQKNAGGNAEFIAAANPANVLALVEALEAAQQNNDGVAGMAEHYETTISMLKGRIAELESRTVTVKLPDYRNSPDMHTKQYYEAIGFNQGLDACEIALRAAGIQVIEGEGQ